MIGLIRGMLGVKSIARATFHSCTVSQWRRYNVVKGGVPSQEDVFNAVDDLEMLYRACSLDLLSNQFIFGRL